MGGAPAGTARGAQGWCARGGGSQQPAGAAVKGRQRLTRKRHLAEHAVHVEEGDGGEHKAKGDERRGARRVCAGATNAGGAGSCGRQQGFSNQQLCNAACSHTLASRPRPSQAAFLTGEPARHGATQHSAHVKQDGQVARLLRVEVRT